MINVDEAASTEQKDAERGETGSCCVLAVGRRLSSLKEPPLGSGSLGF